MEQFYFVADWGSRHYLHVPNVMLSAGAIWQPISKYFIASRFELPNSVERVILDSGGYSFYMKYGKYPFDLEKYIELVYLIQDQSPLFKVAILDYPCEPKLDRHRPMTNKERIDKTISNAVECFQADRKIPWLPVIQGYEIDEYSSCIDQYKDVGIKSDYWAIGSLCSRKGQKMKIRNIVSSIVEYTGDVKLHSFGLTLSYLSDPQIFNSIYSTDSSSWNYRARTMAEKPEMIRKHLAKINLLYCKLHQTSLLDFYDLGS